MPETSGQQRQGEGSRYTALHRFADIAAQLVSSSHGRTVTWLSIATGSHSTTVRHHIDILYRRGLIYPAEIVRMQRGRPAVVWRWRVEGDSADPISIPEDAE